MSERFSLWLKSPKKLQNHAPAWAISLSIIWDLQKFINFDHRWRYDRQCSFMNVNCFSIEDSVNYRSKNYQMIFCFVEINYRNVNWRNFYILQFTCSFDLSKRVVIKCLRISKKVSERKYIRFYFEFSHIYALYQNDQISVLLFEFHQVYTKTKKYVCCIKKF